MSFFPRYVYSVCGNEHPHPLWYGYPAVAGERPGLGAQAEGEGQRVEAGHLAEELKIKKF